eukprot:1191476-Prorocentrum_minimum.AAC.6
MLLLDGEIFLIVITAKRVAGEAPRGYQCSGDGGDGGEGGGAGGEARVREASHEDRARHENEVKNAPQLSPSTTGEFRTRPLQRGSPIGGEGPEGHDCPSACLPVCLSATVAH